MAASDASQHALAGGSRKQSLPQTQQVVLQPGVLLWLTPMLCLREQAGRWVQRLQQLLTQHALLLLQLLRLVLLLVAVVALVAQPVCWGQAACKQAAANWLQVVGLYPALLLLVVV